MKKMKQIAEKAQYAILLTPVGVGFGVTVFVVLKLIF